MIIKKIILTNFINKLWLRIIVTLVISFTLVLLVSNFHVTMNVKENASLQEFSTHLDRRIPVLMKEYSIPGVTIALIQKGQTTWSKAYGYADLEQGRRMTTDTYCRVESISKSITAWGVMKLVEQGKIDLDKPVKQYISNWDFPESELSVEKVTARKLLANTAGMPFGRYF